MEFPGLIDLSYFVDFQSLDLVVRKNGLHSWMAEQRDFLRAMGLDARVRVVQASNQRAEVVKELPNQVERLTSPDKMGSIYKFFYFGETPLYPFGDQCAVHF